MLRKKQSFLILYTLFALLSASFHIAYGQGTNIKFRHISLKNGLSQSSINCIFQDKKGFVWFGTQDGLNKYDGYEFTIFKNIPEDSTSISNSYIHDIIDVGDQIWVATDGGINIFDEHVQKFKNLNTNNSKLRSNSVLSLYKDNENNVWSGTANGHGLSKYDQSLQEFINYDLDTAVAVTSIIEDEENVLWMSTENSGLVRFDSKNERFISDTSSPLSVFNSYQVHVVFKDQEGDIYIGTNQNGLFIWNPKKKALKQYTNNSLFLGLSSNNITAIFQDHAGIIWVGTNDGGINKFDKKKEEFFTYKRKVNDESSINSNDIISIFEDRSNVLWIGTGLGVNHFDLLKQNFNHYQPGATSINSISGNIVWSIFKDENDLFWIGTNEGLNKFDREQNTFSSYLPNITVAGEKRNTSIYSILKDKQGRIWLGTDGGIYNFNEALSRFSPFLQSSNRSRTYIIYQDSKDRIWAGTKNGLLLFNSSGVLLYSFQKNESNPQRSLPSNVIRTILEDKDGIIWVGSDEGLCSVTFKNSQTPVLKTFKANLENVSPISNNTILSLQEDDKGYIWIGTFGGGLNRFDKNEETFINYSQKEGLPNNVIYGILKDENNTLWLSTNYGISSFNIKEKSIRNFDESDGLQSNEFNLGAHFKSDEGELFFGGIKGFNSFFPSSIRTNKIVPQIILTDFQLFNASVEIGPKSVLTKHISEMEEIELSYRDNVFSFSFAALHYSMPERNRYAYKMEGFDENWVYDDNSRKAKYTNLDPGSYVFKVKGTNSDKVWGETLSIPVIIKPPFWKIKWVWALIIIVVAGASFTYYRSYLRSIKAQKEALEGQVKERTKELIGKNEEVEKQRTLLVEEKDKLETLLLNILPQSTVEELKKKGKATARSYNKATVMFTDFKSFTKISEKLSATELVEKLDSFFIKFDEIIESYDVEKIKTIGDSYMCAGGIPIRNKSNPIDVVLASLDIQRTMDDFAKKNPDEPWGLRLGVHTGNLVAGVIGIKRFAYDIWGDTVNVASRVESSGEVGKVNISEQTYNEIKYFFECEYRGKIHAKNKGEIDMYFVNGIKSELSEEGQGIKPNKAFWEYTDLFLYSKIDFRGAETFIIEKLRKNLSKDLYYHSLKHTIDVCNATERIAIQEGVSGEDIFILKMVALYHDAGYIEKYRDNEHIGVKMAMEDLPKFGFKKEHLKTIEELIHITFVENEPTTQLEKIIRDADLDYLGRDDFEEISDALKRELIHQKLISSDKEWDEIQVDFIGAHQYYTETSIKLREAKKQENLKKVKERLNAYVS